MLAIYDNLDQLIDQISLNRGTLEVRFKDKVRFNNAYSKIQKYMNQSTIGIEPSKYNFNGTEIRTVANLVSNIHGAQAAAGMNKVEKELKLKPETFAGAKQPVVTPAAKPVPATKPVTPTKPAVGFDKTPAPDWQHGERSRRGGGLSSKNFMSPMPEFPPEKPEPGSTKPGGMKR